MIKLFTSNEVAEQLRYHPESIRRLIRSGKIKSVKRGRRWLVTETTLEHISANGLPS